MSNSILIIDDESSIRMLLGRILELEGYEVLKAKDRLSALGILRKSEVQVILCDVFLPDGNGVDMVPELQKLAPAAKIILLTAHGNIPDGVQAIKNGAFDYIVKGDDNLKIIPIVSRAMDAIAAERKKNIRHSLVRQGLTAKYSFDDIIGSSQAIREDILMAKRYSRVDSNVLIVGETGTGKEVFAHAIHNGSTRSGKSFVALNCSAFSRELLESELFGYEKGAFTGAVGMRKGRFEAADGGTLFLDEIGELPLLLQAKLLRALQQGEVQRVGSDTPIIVDVRVIAATNRNLREEVSEGRFREDLYYRLNVIGVEVPSLRERREDIPVLATAFLERFALANRKEIKGFTPQAMDALLKYSWPGNVRELENAVERAAILCLGEYISERELPMAVSSAPKNNDAPTLAELQGAAGEEPISMTLDEMERAAILRTLQDTGDNKSEAARRLGITRATLHNKLRRYDME